MRLGLQLNSFDRDGGSKRFARNLTEIARIAEEAGFDRTAVARTLPRLLRIVLDATIVNVAPPSIQEHLDDSRTRVAVGCSGPVP